MRKNIHIHPLFYTSIDYDFLSLTDPFVTLHSLYHTHTIWPCIALRIISPILTPVVQGHFMLTFLSLTTQFFLVGFAKTLQWWAYKRIQYVFLVFFQIDCVLCYAPHHTVYVVITTSSQYASVFSVFVANFSQCWMYYCWLDWKFYEESWDENDFFSSSLSLIKSRY